MLNNFRTRKPSQVIYDENKGLLEWIDSLVFAFFVASIVFIFFIQKAEVDGISMEPNLYENDQLIVYKFLYTPKKTDIIVATPEDFGISIVKRVIGTPNDKIDFDFEKGQLYVNDILIEETYIKEIMERPNISANILEFPVILGYDEYFIMGDNRNNSMDSRYEDIGILKHNEIMGKVILRFWPINKLSSVK